MTVNSFVFLINSSEYRFFFSEMAGVDGEELIIPIQTTVILFGSSSEPLTTSDAETGNKIPEGSSRVFIF